MRGDCLLAREGEEEASLDLVGDCIARRLPSSCCEGVFLWEETCKKQRGSRFYTLLFEARDCIATLKRQTV